MEEGNKPSTGGAHPGNNNNPPSLSDLPPEVLHRIFDEIPSSEVTMTAVLSKYFGEVFAMYIEPQIRKLIKIRTLAGKDMFLFSSLLLGVSDIDLDLYRIELANDPEKARKYQSKNNLFTFFADFPFCLTLDEVQTVFKYQGFALSTELQMAYLTYLIAWTARANTAISFEKRCNIFLDIASYSCLDSSSKWRTEIFTQAEHEALFLCCKFKNEQDIFVNIPEEDARSLVAQFVVETIKNPIRRNLYLKYVGIFMLYPMGVLIENRDFLPIIDFTVLASELDEEYDNLMIYFVNILFDLFSNPSNNLKLSQEEYEAIKRIHEKLNNWDNDVRTFWESHLDS